MNNAPQKAPPHREHTTALPDLVIISLVAVFVFILACVFDAFRVLAREWHFSEVVTGVSISAFAFGIFSLRRWREVVREVDRRKQVEEALREARDELEARVVERTAELAETNQELQREIAERQQAEEKLLTYQEQLRYLASELSLAEERTRRRIATGLHDRICQALAICKIKLGELRESASAAEPAELIDRIRELMEEAIRDARSLTFELSPPVLYELGFEAAVESLTEQMARQHGIRARFRDDGQPKPLSNDLRVLLFQAVRELMVNVVKHAQASNMNVSLGKHGGSIRITVEDDGRGFSASAISSRERGAGGFGLFSIRERLDHLGGRLDVESAPGHGTRVVLTAALEHDEETVAGGVR